MKIEPQAHGIRALLMLTGVKSIEQYVPKMCCHVDVSYCFCFVRAVQLQCNLHGSYLGIGGENKKVTVRFRIGHLCTTLKETKYILGRAESQPECTPVTQVKLLIALHSQNCHSLNPKCCDHPHMIHFQTLIQSN
jgi:hypothetical protein